MKYMKLKFLKERKIFITLNGVIITLLSIISLLSVFYNNFILFITYLGFYFTFVFVITFQYDEKFEGNLLVTYFIITITWLSYFLILPIFLSKVLH